MRPPFIFRLLFSQQRRTHQQRTLPPSQGPILELFLGACACAFVRAFRNYGVISAIRNTVSKRPVRYQSRLNPPILDQLMFTRRRPVIESSSSHLHSGNTDASNRTKSTPDQPQNRLQYRDNSLPAHCVVVPVEGHELTRIEEQLLELRSRAKRAEECCGRLKSENESLVLQVQSKERQCSQMREECNSTRSEIKEMAAEALKERLQRNQSWAQREQQYVEIIQALRQQIRDFDTEREAACAEIKSVMEVSKRMRHDFQQVVASRNDALRSLRESRDQERRAREERDALLAKFVDGG